MSYANLRRGRYSEPDSEYRVTAVTRGRARVFDDFNCARRLAVVMRETADADMADWLAWVIMPDHMHALVRLGSRASLALVVRTVKGRSARRVNEAAGWSGPLWQPNFHDHALRHEEDRRAVARYIIANPVRAGLVLRVGDYPHWDCVWL